MCVKLRKSTIVVIITSWILFFIAAFLAYAKLDQMKQERLTNEKIFQQTTQKNTSLSRMSVSWTTFFVSYALEKTSSSIRK